MSWCVLGTRSCDQTAVKCFLSSTTQSSMGVLQTCDQTAVPWTRASNYQTIPNLCTLKTKVINSCLNPVWNEELTFSVTEPIGVLKLEVFDRDTFKQDDKMGHAHLNLQPIVSASRLRRALRLTTGETKLRKVAPDGDNCLLVESFITYVDGEIVQEVRLRLRDVESGEVELKLRWIDNASDARETSGPERRPSS